MNGEIEIKVWINGNWVTLYAPTEELAVAHVRRLLREAGQQ